MKKLLLALSVASLFATSALAVEDADLSGLDEGVTAPIALPDGQGVVNFNGKLMATTCQLETKNQTVNLPHLDVKDFENGTTGVTKFNIKLTGCTEYDGKSVALTFTSPDDQLVTVGSEKVLKNKSFVAGGSNQGAGNVGLKVLAKNGDVSYNPFMNKDTNYPYHSLSPLSKAEAVFPFTVEYIKVGSGNVTPGTVSAALPFTVVYK